MEGKEKKMDKFNDILLVRKTATAEKRGDSCYIETHKNGKLCTGHEEHVHV